MVCVVIRRVTIWRVCDDTAYDDTPCDDMVCDHTVMQRAGRQITKEDYKRMHQEEEAKLAAAKANGARHADGILMMWG